MKTLNSRTPSLTNERRSKRMGVIERLEDRRLLAGGTGLPPDMIADPYAFIGDHSGSNSEIWAMQVGGQVITAPAMAMSLGSGSSFRKDSPIPSR